MFKTTDPLHCGLEATTADQVERRKMQQPRKASHWRRASEIRTQMLRAAISHKVLLSAVDLSALGGKGHLALKNERVVERGLHSETKKSSNCHQSFLVSAHLC